MILFLDFDGVLHPDAVYLSRRGIELRTEGELFMWSSQLSDALKDYPDIRIVLSTSWARKLGYNRARKALPPILRSRVIGATWHSAMSRDWTDRILWDVQSRYNQIASYLNRLPYPAPWLAIDDDDEGWPECQRKRLVLTDPTQGLSALDTLDELINKLEASSGLGFHTIEGPRMTNVTFNARIDVVASHALSVFENEVAAMQWLKTQNVALADRTPLECCETEAGAQQVQRILNALEWGGVA